MPVSPYPVDAALTAISVGYRNMEYIADQVLPRVPVDKQTFKYMRYPIEEAFTVYDTAVGRKGRPNEINLSAVEDEASTQDHGLEDSVPVTDQDNADSRYDPEGRATMKLTDYVALAREVRVSNAVFSAANYAAGQKVTLSGTSQFSDFANSDPLAVMLAGLDACIVRPNLVTMGQAVWTKVRQHPKVVKAVLGNAGDSGVASRQAVAELLEVEEVLVGRSYLNSAKRGQAASLSRAWGKHIALTYRNRNGGTEGEMSFGITAQWGGRVVRKEFDSKIGLRGATRIVVGESVKELIIASGAGYFIENAVA